ncbi:uncharacterized protein A4U43_C06F7310 [Asparagus officinalis]|uniref:DUF4378 domain-containing protein n=1 Tax=Asparagus officinalis TaxID=4686 RepID=A0A5P1EMJ0_ASPOF|nr:uncharacterized protein LOC109844296 [Asparagus officinalis]ONK66387.1 uncharacterized protein A4U43_C06F7310 [Asparagus officinalis]
MSLAVAENRPQQQNAGCVGIIFQLFSKKKLFSKTKKLLPPVKNFAADDKMPTVKLFLIAEENRGGFPKLESEPDPDLESQMQAPGVVARLMGLESMPVVDAEKPRKALDSKFCSDSGGHSRLDQGLCLVSESNLQKSRGGFLERFPVEALHKGLIYGSKKKHHMKLEVPVKSPRLNSRSSASRFVHVANRILEPGLQSKRNGAKQITYIRSWEENREGDQKRSHDFVAGSSKINESSLGLKESLVSECGASSSELSSGYEERKKIKPSVVLSGQSKNGLVPIQPMLKAEEVCKMKKSRVVPNRDINNRSPVTKAKLNVESRANNQIGSKKILASVGDQYGKPVLRNNNPRHSQLLLVRDTSVRTETKVNQFNRAKNFVAMNKNLNNYTRSRSPTKVSGSCRTESERNGLEKNLARKRSQTYSNLENYNGNFVKEKCVISNVMSRKGTGATSNQPGKGSRIKSNSSKMDCDNSTTSNNDSIVSFTFNSPMRQNSRSTTHEEMAQVRRSHGELRRDACRSKKLMSDAKRGSSSVLKEMALRGDELSCLLEEKINELSSLDKDKELVQGKSTFSILEELISALTMGVPESHKNGEICFDAANEMKSDFLHKQMINSNDEFEEETQHDITVDQLAGVSEQPSPVSVLEASFSNDSCSLGSFNESSGNKTHFGLPETFNNTKSLDMDSDLLDSASSSNISQSLNKTPIKHEAEILETELSTASETVLDTELLFESIYGSTKYSLDSFLLDTLESIIDVLSLDFKPKEGNQLREFLYECANEVLDSKFTHSCWLKLPLYLTRDCLMREIQVEIKGWMDLAGKGLDDLIEKEMKESNLNWTVCEIEAFETGVRIQGDILHELIDEMVVDLC